MTLPISGPISLSQVNTELSKPAVTNISLGQADVRSLAGIPAGTIKMSDLYGKAATGTQTKLPTQFIDFDNAFPQNKLWVNLFRIGIQNNTPATFFVNNVASGTDHPTTRTAIGKKFNFSIPAGKTLTNLQVRVRGKASFGGQDIRIHTIQLSTNSTLIGNNKASLQPLGSSFTTHTFSGGPAYWGTTLNATQVNANNFAVSAIFHNNATDKDSDGDVEYAWLEVTATW